MEEQKDYLVLYRKHRPASFEDVAGQNHIVLAIKNAVCQNRVNHAYLFSGPRGVGKTSMARILAKAINCNVYLNSKEKNARSDIPCNKCANCLEINKGFAVDLIEIDAASNRGIDEIRIIKEAVNLHPLKMKYKVYIIDEVHMLTKEAFNALLKTLEEPPRHVIFILATTEADKLPETIISRTQHFKFAKPSERLIRESLKKIAEKEKISIDDEAVNIISLFAEGSFRDAHGMMDQISNLGDKKINGETARNFFGVPSENLISDFLSSLFKGEADEAFKIANCVCEQGSDLKTFLKLILRDLRFMMILSVAPNMASEIEKMIGSERLEILKQRKENADNEKLEFALKTFLDAYSSIFHSYFPQLPLELAIAKIISKN